MKLDTREGWLACATLAVVLTALGYVMVEKDVKALGTARTELASVDQLLNKYRAVLDRQEKLAQRFESLRDVLPSYEPAQAVDAVILRRIDELSRRHGITMLKTVPGEEHHAGHLYETSVDCSWEGSLEALTRFLYALLNESTNLDVRQLSVSPMAGGAGRLRGSLTMDYAYTRTSHHENT